MCVSKDKLRTSKVERLSIPHHVQLACLSFSKPSRELGTVSSPTGLSHLKRR